jgi:putative flavoprotein involved in K+ transport
MEFSRLNPKTRVELKYDKKTRISSYLFLSAFEGSTLHWKEGKCRSLIKEVALRIQFVIDTSALEIHGNKGRYIMERIKTIVIGGSQSGLAVSYWLSQFGEEHVILEKSEVGSAWRTGRWDSFTLVSPNWTTQLPGYPYSGEDPDGYLPRDEIVKYLEDYARQIGAPLRLGVEATSLEQSSGSGRFAVRTNQGEYEADYVIAATGAFQKPKIPTVSEKIAKEFYQIHSGEYRSADKLPSGAVLVIGSAQSGCQITDDLNQQGRKVYLSTGTARRVPRRYRGKDIFFWVDKLGLMDETPEMLEKPEERFAANPQLSGAGGGRLMNLHQFARDGVTLLGRLKSAQGRQLNFAPDLKENLAHADKTDAGIRKAIDEYIMENELEAPAEETPNLTDGFEAETITNLDLGEAGIQTIIWACGYSFDYSWIKFPIFDQKGYPQHKQGRTEIPGLYFLGLQYQTRLKSSLLFGVGQDAKMIAEHIHQGRKIQENLSI